MYIILYDHYMKLLMSDNCGYIYIINYFDNNNYKMLLSSDILDINSV
jgi:hypothetical protein